MNGCDLLVLAPHLDDGPFSCGGLLHKRSARGERVRVVTVFAGDPPPAGSVSALAQRLHAAMGLSAGEAMATRRREDEAACRILAADCEQWSFCDALYRGTDEVPHYPTLGAIFGPPQPGDEGLRETLTARLRALPPADLVLAPLAAGGHVDHRLLRQAAAQVWGAALGYYEDVPYVLRPWPTGRRNLRRALDRRSGRRSAWRAESEPLGAPDLDAKLRAMAAYPSQVKPIFRSAQRMEQWVRRYTRRVGGERRWYRTL